MDLIGLRGERVRLIPSERDLHLANALRWFNDPEVTATIEANFGLTRRQADAFFERMETNRETDLHWAILAESGRHIGFIAPRNIPWPPRSAAGRLILGERDAWGRGYATDAVRVRTRFAFEQMGLHRIEGHSINPIMARVYQKCGYVHEGIARQK